MHHQWSRYAIQFRDDPQDISEPLINDSCVAPSGGDCRSITSSNTLPGALVPCWGRFLCDPINEEAANLGGLRSHLGRLNIRHERR